MYHFRTDFDLFLLAKLSGKFMVYNFVYFNTPNVVFSVPYDLIIYVVLYILEDAPPPKKSVLGGIF